MLKYMSKEESLQILEQQREKYEWDEYSRLKGARREGFAEGIAEGRSSGLAEGIAEGERENALRTARAALAKGLSVDLVSDITGLDAATIMQLTRD
jgi:predicted transposase YdaD